MKRILAVALLAFGLAGCAQLQQAWQAGALVTASYTNPVTKDQLYQAENALTIAFAGLNAYKKSCALGAADTHCKDNVAKIQAYTRRIPPLLAQLRTFVKTNDQINAVVVYNQIVQLVTNLKAEAVASGVPVGGV